MIITCTVMLRNGLSLQMIFNGMCLAPTLIACAASTDFSSKKAELLKGCARPNQLESFYDSTVKPHARVFVDSDFSASQIYFIQKAVDQWNAVTQEYPKSFMRLQTTRIQNRIKEEDYTQCKSDDERTEGDVYVIPVKNDQRWNSLKIDHKSRAVTMTCSKNHKLVYQTILINTLLVKDEQFHSVILHEIGHARGLDHSCKWDKSGGPTYIGCSSLDFGHPYIQAVMFPALRQAANGVFEIKENLQQNDIERAECAAQAYVSW